MNQSQTKVLANQGTPDDRAARYNGALHCLIAHVKDHGGREEKMMACVARSPDVSRWEHRTRKKLHPNSLRDELISTKPWT